MPHTGAPAGNGALYMPVTLFSEDNKRRWMGQALLDTGAQFAMIHPSVVSELGLTARGESDIDSAIGQAKTRAYMVRVSAPDIFDDILSALETQSRERFVLGRQFLKRTRLEVDWPNGRFALEKGV